MTSITSRPFNGQLGSAAQISDIVFASGKGTQYVYGTGKVLVRAQNNQPYLNIRDDGDTAWLGFQAKDAFMNGNIDMGSMANGLTVDNVRVNLNWILGV